MSTVRLKKDQGGDKANAIVSRPFTVAQTLVASGVAEYLPQPKQAIDTKPSVSTEAERHAAEIARLNALRTSDIAALRDEHAEAVKKLEKEHEAAVRKLTAELEAANATITELQANKGGNKK